MYANYCATKKVKFVIISTTMRPVGEKIPVSGKVEARRVAAERGAICWNF